MFYLPTFSCRNRFDKPHNNLWQVEFSVPSSTEKGIRRSSPEDRYPIDRSFLRVRDGGSGHDWAVFRVNRNTITNKFPGERQGWFRIFHSRYGMGQTIRVTGYGSSREARLSYTQQSSIGARQEDQRGAIHYAVDTTSGNSGSAVIDEATDRLIGVHTNGGCRDFGSNFGTAIFANRDFSTAIRECLYGNGMH